MKELLRIIKFVLDTRQLGLKFCPSKKDGAWQLKALCDSDFAGDKETRISVGGYVVYFLGVPVAWRSKGMKSVCLSSTEAEYVSISEVVKEISFILQVLESMEVEVALPVVVQVDNIGAIWLANNKTTSDRTKHVDVRAHFTREFIEDGKIKIVFVRSKDNDADLFTKNVTGELYHTHSSKLVFTKSELDRRATGRVLESDGHETGTPVGSEGSKGSNVSQVHAHDKAHDKSCDKKISGIESNGIDSNGIESEGTKEGTGASV